METSFAEAISKTFTEMYVPYNIKKIKVHNIDDFILLDNSAFVRITLNFTLK